MSRRRGRPAAILGLTAALLAMSVGAVPVAAAAPTGGGFRVVLDVGDSCLTIESPPLGSALTVLQKRGTTIIKQRTGVPAVDDTEVCLAPLKPKDVVVIKRGSSKLRSVAIPNLRLSIDAADDMVTMRAPASGHVDGYLEVTDNVAGIFSHGSGWTVFPEPVPGTSDVTFTVDTRPGGTGIDVRGGDVASYAWVNAKGDLFRIETAVPSIMFGNTIWKVSGRAARGSRPTITAKNGTAFKASVTPKASPTTGRWSGILRKNGTIMPIEPGWKLYHSQTAGAMLTVLNLTFVVDIEAPGGSMTATCFPKGEWVLLWNGVANHRGVAPNNGVVALDDITDGHGDLGGGDTIELRCENRAGGAQQFITSFEEG